MQKNLKEELLNTINNTKNLKLDLLNGIVLDLTFDNQINAYRGYSEELELSVGIWEIKTLYKIATEKINNCKLIMEE